MKKWFQTFIFRAILNKSQPKLLSVGLHAIPNDAELIGNTKDSLYPFYSVKLIVVFVYGSDYQRKFSDNLFSKLMVFVFNWTNLFVISAAVVLCFLRRLRRLQHDGFISSLIDVTVIFTGGGTLRFDHKLERWFFVIMSIGALFLNAICLEPTLFPSFLQHQQRVDTFNELSEINPPVYVAMYWDRMRDT